MLHPGTHHFTVTLFTGRAADGLRPGSGCAKCEGQPAMFVQGKCQKSSASDQAQLTVKHNCQSTSLCTFYEQKWHVSLGQASIKERMWKSEHQPATTITPDSRTIDAWTLAWKITLSVRFPGSLCQNVSRCIHKLYDYIHTEHPIKICLRLADEEQILSLVQTKSLQNDSSIFLPVGRLQQRVL